MAMVAVLQSAGLIASSPVHSTSSSSSSSPAPVRHLSLALPHAHRPLPLCSGLRVSFLSKKQKNAHIRPGLVACSSPTIVCQQQQEAIAAGEVTDKTWKELVLNSKVPVLVDFWAPWCGPCRMIAPLVDDLAKQYAGKLICLKLNTDESPNLATEYGIRSIPTVMIFKGGEKKDTVIGAVPKAALTSLVEKFLDM